jgi:hypothetical protein
MYAVRCLLQEVASKDIRALSLGACRWLRGRWLSPPTSNIVQLGSPHRSQLMTSHLVAPSHPRLTDPLPHWLVFQ